MTTQTFSTHPLVRPFKSVANYFSRIARDVDSVIERDPAARSKLEVMLTSEKVCAEGVESQVSSP